MFIMMQNRKLLSWNVSQIVIIIDFISEYFSKKNEGLKYLVLGLTGNLTTYAQIMFHYDE